MENNLRVRGIALRAARRGSMEKVNVATAEADGGLVGDVPRKSLERGVTFLSQSQWYEVMSELGVDLPWHTRRANVLVEGCDSLAPLIGRRIRIGDDVEVEIIAETRPCGLMEWLHAGLEKALCPDCRGGVYGRVLQAGSFAVNDSIHVI